MSIKSICTTKVVTIQKNANLTEVINLMQSHHVGSVVVVDTLKGKNIPVGIITDRDITLAINSTHSHNRILVEHIMQSAPLTIKESQGIYEAIKKMQKYGVKRLPVVNSDGSLVGIVSKDDILTLVGEELSMLAKIELNQLNNERGSKLPIETHTESHI